MKTLNQSIQILILYMLISCAQVHEAKRNNIFDPGSENGVLSYFLNYGATQKINPTFIIITVENRLPIHSYTLAFNASVQLKAMDNVRNDKTSEVTWSSSDTSIATVSNTGLVTALSQTGNTTITADHPILAARTLTVNVNATGTSVLANENK